MLICHRNKMLNCHRNIHNITSHNVGHFQLKPLYEPICSLPQICLHFCNYKRKVRYLWIYAQYFVYMYFNCYSVYYKYNELGLVKNILCFHDELPSISVQGESNNGDDFVTALWAFISFIRVILCFVKGPHINVSCWGWEE